MLRASEENPETRVVLVLMETMGTKGKRDRLGKRGRRGQREIVVTQVSYLRLFSRVAYLEVEKSISVAQTYVIDRF